MRKLCAATLVSAALLGAGCSSGPSSHGVGSGSFRIVVSPSGCATGSIHLSAAPSSAKSGSLVTLRVATLPDNDYSVAAVGTIGTASGDSYSPLWDISVLTNGKPGSSDTAVTATTKVQETGVGLSNPTFTIEVPPLKSGTYQVRFPYTIAPLPTMPHGLVAGTYTVCTQFTVS